MGAMATVSAITSRSSGTPIRTEVAESIAADAVDHQNAFIANSTEMSRLGRAFDGAAVGHDHRAGRNPRRMHHRHAGEPFERGRDGHCREEAEGDRGAVAAQRRGT